MANLAKKNLYESISIYQEGVEQSLAAADDNPQQGEPDMLSLVTGQVLEQTKKESQDRARLVDGKRYGFLTLSKHERKRVRAGVSYLCKCDCGGETFLPRLEILTRARMRAGCLGFDCPYSPDEVKAWHNPKFALWLQLTTLLKTQPDEVTNEWGGRAYEELGLVPIEAGLEQFIHDALPLVGKGKHTWWLERKNPFLPYAAFNIQMQSMPKFDVLGGKARYIMYGGTVYSVLEIARMFGLHAGTIMKWRRLTIDDEQLMEMVMRETDK